MRKARLKAVYTTLQLPLLHECCRQRKSVRKGARPVGTILLVLRTDYQTVHENLPLANHIQRTHPKHLPLFLVSVGTFLSSLIQKDIQSANTCTKLCRCSTMEPLLRCCLRAKNTSYCYLDAAILVQGIPSKSAKATLRTLPENRGSMPRGGGGHQGKIRALPQLC